MENSSFLSHATHIYHTNQPNVGRYNQFHGSDGYWLVFLDSIFVYFRHPHPHLQGSHSSYIACWGGGRPFAAPFKLQGKPVKQKERRHGGAMLQVEDVTCFHQKSNRTLPMDP